MKLLLKKYKIFLGIIVIPYLFIVITCTVRTNKEVTLTGELTKVDSLISIDTTYEKSGSYNSVFVINYQNATIFQTLILKNSPINDIEDVYEGYNHLSTSELSNMGRIQHNYAKETSIVVAYEKAAIVDDNIKLDYKMLGMVVYYYKEFETDLKIGDCIYKVNDVDVFEDEDLFKEEFSKITKDSKISFIRNNKSYDLVLGNSNVSSIYSYFKYEINEDTSTPKLRINSSTHHGSSAGFIQTLSNFDSLVEVDYSKGLTVCGTGTIDRFGNVGAIGGVKQKLYTAMKNKADIFFVPKANEEEALEVYRQMNNKEKIKLVIISNFDEALEYLKLWN